MWDHALPILYGIVLWWFSTGAVLAFVQGADRAPGLMLAGAGALLAASLALLAATADATGPAGLYVAFGAAIGVWGAQEIAFLTGWITGPWRQACPAGLAGWRRAGYATAAILYHELALVASGLAVLAVTAGGANRVGAWTFGALLLMRISAKLNVFLGVPNITESFLPPRIAYLKTFFARRPMNLLLPVSVTAGTVALVLLVEAAGAATGDAATGLTLIATLVALGLLEHWFFVLPLPAEALWGWSLAGRDTEPAAAAPPANIVRLDAALQRATLRAAGPPLYDAARARPGARAVTTRSE